MDYKTPEENYKTWRAMSEEAFSFLKTEFDYSVTDFKVSGSYSLRFENGKTWVAIVFAPARLEFNVSVGEIGGKMNYDLLELVVVHGGKVRFPKAGFAEHLNRNEPKEEVEVDYEKSLRVDDLYDEKRLRVALSEYAKLLQKYGNRVLKGDSSAFTNIDNARLKGLNLFPG